MGASVVQQKMTCGKALIGIPDLFPRISTKQTEKSYVTGTPQVNTLESHS